MAMKRYTIRCLWASKMQSKLGAQLHTGIVSLICQQGFMIGAAIPRQSLVFLATEAPPDNHSCKSVSDGYLQPSAASHSRG